MTIDAMIQRSETLANTSQDLSEMWLMIAALSGRVDELNRTLKLISDEMKRKK